MSMKSLFLYFLRVGLWGEAEGPCPESLPEETWRELFRMSCEQAVCGVWVDGVSQTACRPPERLWTQWIFHTARIGQMNRWLRQVEERWLENLRGQGMEGEVFKGSSAGRWYRKPLLRCYGDIDLVVWKGWERLAGYLQAAGYRCVPEGGSWAMQDGQASIEWHPCREFVYNPWINGRLQRMLRADRTGPELYVVCLILHLRRHVLTYGIGLKQVCDVAVMLRRAPLDFGRLASLLQALHLADFSGVLFGLLEKYLGGGFVFPVPPRRGRDVDLLDEIVWNEGYRLKMERESLSACRSEFGRVRRNAWFWLGRSVRLCRWMPGEAFFFLCTKFVKRLAFRKKA